MIKITGLRKSFGDLEVLRDINLHIKAGEIFGLIGRSGAGKSTLLRCVNGLETYSAGSLKVDGVEINHLGTNAIRSFRKEIGMIFQQFSLVERKNVYENIALPMQCWGVKKKSIDDLVLELSEIVGISDKLKDKPRTLSGGQKQRVAIARALTMRPKILLSDESTSALDPVTTSSILQLLREINEKFGITIIMVTHQMSVIRSICQSVSLLRQGRLVVAGQVEDVFTSRPEEFNHFLGEDSDLPVTTDVNLEIVVSGNRITQPLLSGMARELDVDFSIIGGKMEKFRDNVLGSWIINIEPENLNKVARYLDQKSIIWREISENDRNGGSSESSESDTV